MRCTPPAETLKFCTPSRPAGQFRQSATRWSRKAGNCRRKKRNRTAATHDQDRSELRSGATGQRPENRRRRQDDRRRRSILSGVRVRRFLKGEKRSVRLARGIGNSAGRGSRGTRCTAGEPRDRCKSDGRAAASPPARSSHRTATRAVRRWSGRRRTWWLFVLCSSGAFDRRSPTAPGGCAPGVCRVGRAPRRELGDFPDRGPRVVALPQQEAVGVGKLLDALLATTAPRPAAAPNDPPRSAASAATPRRSRRPRGGGGGPGTCGTCGPETRRNGSPRA